MRMAVDAGYGEINSAFTFVLHRGEKGIGRCGGRIGEVYLIPGARREQLFCEMEGIVDVDDRRGGGPAVVTDGHEVTDGGLKAIAKGGVNKQGRGDVIAIAAGIFCYEQVPCAVDISGGAVQRNTDAFRPDGGDFRVDGAAATNGEKDRDDSAAEAGKGSKSRAATDEKGSIICETHGLWDCGSKYTLITIF